MNQMKFLSCFLFLSFILGACQKEDFISKSNQEIDDLNLPCAYPSCVTEVPRLQEIYQEFANNTCDTIWAEIVCCQDDIPTISMVMITPSVEICGEAHIKKHTQ